MTNKYWMIAVVPMLCAACAGSHSERVRDTRLERIDDHEEAKLDKVEQRAQERTEMVDEDFNAEQEAIADSDMPSADRSADMLDDAKSRSEYQVQTRAELDKLEVRIQAAEQKADVLGARVPEPLREELHLIAQEQVDLSSELSQMGEAAPAHWQSNKSKLDERISKLDDRVGDVTDMIDNVAG